MSHEAGEGQRTPTEYERQCIRGSAGIGVWKTDWDYDVVREVLIYVGATCQGRYNSKNVDQTTLFCGNIFGCERGVDQCVHY